MERKESHERMARAQLDLMKSRLHALLAKAKLTKEKSRAEILEDLDLAKKDLDTLKEKIEGYREVGVQTLEEIETGFEKGFQELKQKLDHLHKRITENTESE